MKITHQTKVAVLMGGWSGECEISRKTGQALAQGLREQGYQGVVEVEVTRNLAADLQRDRPEVAFIALHGPYGEDGTVQGLLEYLSIPYTGTGVTGSALAMDKVLSKQVFQASQIPTPQFIVTSTRDDVSGVEKKIAAELGFPVIAKPPCEGSTLGMTVVNDPSAVEVAMKAAAGFDQRILWEKYLQGTELTVGFLQGKPLPTIEIVPAHGFYDFDAKYTYKQGQTQYHCPARISAETQEQVEAVAVQAFTALGCDSLARVDLIWASQTPWVLEVNTIPGMTETSLVPKAAHHAGISFPQLAETILTSASLKGGGVR